VAASTMLHARAIALRADTPAVAIVLHVARARHVRATVRLAAVTPAAAPEVAEEAAAIMVAEAVADLVGAEVAVAPVGAEVAVVTPADMGANQGSFA
jgi:hypothetical protein